MPAERLQKILAAAGVASRRGAEALIAAGRVTVDGRIAQLGDQVDSSAARIEVDGRAVGDAAAAVHVALHKPAGVTATVRDPHARWTILDLLPTALLATRIYPVGRLDRDSEGLLLLTNDGGWAQRVLHPSFGVEREYAVGLAEPLSTEQRLALDRGIRLEEGLATFVHPVRAASAVETGRLRGLLAPPPDERLAWYQVVLRQGWKRQVRRMFGAVGAPVARLVRVRIGSVRLDDLSSGKLRRLRAPEVRSLEAGGGQVGAGTRSEGHRRASGQRGIRRPPRDRSAGVARPAGRRPDAADRPGGRPRGSGG